MWMKVDDQLHAHRKMRAVTRTHATKRRDIAPMGLWVAAGSWSAQNATDGWVPEDELDRWDEDWRDLVGRLIDAGWWWRSDRDGERGYAFNDWHDFNPESGLASRSGAFGNHVRWHANKGVVKDDCEHCPKEPDHPESVPDIGGRSGGDSGRTSRSIALPVPDPTPARPDPEPTNSSATPVAREPDRFDEFWDTYGKKVDRKKAEQRWAVALKKPGVTADLLIAAAAAYVLAERENEGGRFVMDPSRWLLGERWRDERPARATPPSRFQQHMALARAFADQEDAPLPPGFHAQIGPA